MGVAILLIMLFHSGMVLKDPTIFSVFRDGEIGVEMFALLSGMGIRRSLCKDASALRFFKRRFEKIAPSFAIIVIPFSLFQHFEYGASWGHVITQSLGIAAFRGDVAFWFISFILVCYLLAPIFQIVKDRVSFPFALTIVVEAICLLLYVLFGEIIPNNYYWLLRLPVFAFGFDLSDRVADGFRKELVDGRKSVLLAFAAIVLCIAVLYFAREVNGRISRHLISFALTLPILQSISVMLESCDCLIRPLSFMGGITLEAYLLHERIVLPVCSLLDLNNWLLLLIGLAVTIILAKLVSMFSNALRLSHNCTQRI